MLRRKYRVKGGMSFEEEQRMFLGRELYSELNIVN
jgi:hypothetical protein